MLRSILGFLLITGKWTSELHLGHLGSFFDINTYSKQPGQAAATNNPPFWLEIKELVHLVDDSRSSSPTDNDEEFDGDCDPTFDGIIIQRLLEDDVDDEVGEALSALSRADFTLSKVHTLVYVDEGGLLETNLRSKLGGCSNKPSVGFTFDDDVDNCGKVFKSWSFGEFWFDKFFCSDAAEFAGLHLCM